ncbi:PREDICTED: elongation of fatty acids protein 3-like [Tarenaya hassleriana]|uniref:elongation of fatty acids protein 3-like n=1 Tax=Tarenaya hassleriana TaxID=28532 RepID=UPI00053C9AB7|nr:PREDICTED: elongation of fatty acids protein 3-like [Tarenaya hassleriana]
MINFGWPFKHHQCNSFPPLFEWLNSDVRRHLHHPYDIPSIRVTNDVTPRSSLSWPTSSVHFVTNYYGSKPKNNSNRTQHKKGTLEKPSRATHHRRINIHRSTMSTALSALTYYLSEHPYIVGFRWSHAQSFGATWSFLFSSISVYVALSSTLHLLLRFRRRHVPLGHIPDLHSLLMSLISAAIFAGTLISSAAEIRDTRWLWRRSKTSTPLQWLLCFPLGTRPSGRVFFWSYAFYLTRFLHMLRTIFTVLRRRKLGFFRLFCNSAATFMAFLWLEFSQSYQILAILSATLVYAVVYGYRFWNGFGLPGSGFLPTFVVNCQMVLVSCNLVSHAGVLTVHLLKGGCNGIGAWVLNSVLNGAILFLFLNFYVKMHSQPQRNVETCEREKHVWRDN